MDKSFSFTVLPRPPFDFALTVRKWGGWGWLTPFEVFERGALWTGMRFAGSPIGIKLQSRGTTRDPKVRIDVFGKQFTPAGQKRLQTIIAHALGANQDLRPFYALCKKDTVLRVAQKDLCGMHTGEGVSLFDLAVLTVTLQMAPVKRSLDMLYALFHTYGSAIRFDGKTVLLYPVPERLNKASEAELKKRCKLGYRAKYIRGLARACCAGTFPDKSTLTAMDAPEAKKQLLKLPGIGDYSADILNPHRGFPLDIWSVKLFMRLFRIRQTRPFREMIPLVKRWAERRWGEFRGIAFDYILHDLANLKRKFGVDAGNLATDYAES